MMSSLVGPHQSFIDGRQILDSVSLQVDSRSCAKNKKWLQFSSNLIFTKHLTVFLVFLDLDPQPNGIPPPPNGSIGLLRVCHRLPPIFS